METQVLYAFKRDYTSASQLCSDRLTQYIGHLKKKSHNAVLTDKQFYMVTTELMPCDKPSILQYSTGYKLQCVILVTLFLCMFKYTFSLKEESVWKDLCKLLCSIDSLQLTLSMLLAHLNQMVYSTTFMLLREPTSSNPGMLNIYS